MAPTSYPTISFVAGIVSSVLLLAAAVDAFTARGAGLPALLLPALVAAGIAIGFGLSALRDPHGQAGTVMGHSVAVVGLVLGLAYAAVALVIPLIVLILILLFSWPAASSSTTCCSAQGSSTSSSCDCGCCGPGCTNTSGPAGCCGGGCGGCGCGGGCGGCGCAALAVLPHAGGLVGALDRLLAHHPDAPEYRADTYRVGGLRLCIGCFTTYPTFLVATAALFALPLGWAALLATGAALALAQAISSAGLARAKAVKVIVKTSLGVGLAMLVVGTLRSPVTPGQKAMILLAAMTLALASTIPRARRMRRVHASCAQSETSAP